MSVLEVTGLAKSFGGLKAVDDVSFDVQPGEVLALIGPNGAGKTTCFNMISGQLRADAGTVSFDGTDISRWPARKIWRLGVGRTFQITATAPSMTVRENVQLALLSYHRKAGNLWRAATAMYQQEADQLLDRVGMARQAARAAGVLAYGDLKRLELAIALAHGPKLLLLDEPTAGMAPGERAELMALIAGIVAEEAISVLFTEHDMDSVFGHADRILVLNRGQVLAEGSVDHVRNDARVREVYLGGGASGA
ncbi:MAG: ABC transporter ATP-binding protein [Aestuariivirgaceae bacterium]